MIRPGVGDVVAVSARGKYYYALLLSKVRLFGGHLVYVFHQPSMQQLPVDQIVSPGASGFHEIVDFIWAKRENRLSRIASKVDITPFNTIRHFKNTFALKGKADFWWIYDESFNRIRRTELLTPGEMAYPLFHRIDDVVMCDLVDQEWTPAKDDRI